MLPSRGGVRRGGVVGNSKIHEPWPSVADLKRSSISLVNAANMIFRSSFQRHICVFQDPLFFKYGWKHDFGREFVT